MKTRPLRLHCFPKVISENSAKALPTLNAPLSAGTVGHFADQPVVETLVISFQMVMSDVSANGRAKMILSERNDPVETIVFYRTNKTLCVRDKFGLLAGNFTVSTSAGESVARNDAENDG